MFNAVTKHEYSGKNEAILAQLGFGEDDAFVTFKQAIKLDGVSGKALKGIKKAATLVRFSRTKKSKMKLARWLQNQSTSQCFTLKMS